MKTALLALLLLAAPDVWAQAPPEPGVGAYTPEQIAQIEQTPIGATVTIRFPAGDDCNTCQCAVQRVSETEVRLGGCQCTAMACLPRPHRFKPEERKESK